jgi:myo-inositol-1-phosphate synthase
MGAVASTFVAGVIAARQGLGEADRLADADGHIRLGKRTENRNPLIKDFVPLAPLDDSSSAAGTSSADDAYDACINAGVLESGKHLEAIADVRCATIKPMPAVFDPTTSSAWTART